MIALLDLKISFFSMNSALAEAFLGLVADEYMIKMAKPELIPSVYIWAVVG